MNGGTNASIEFARRVWSLFVSSFELRAGDQVNIGMAPWTACNYMTALPLNQVRLVVGASGRDSADKALLNSVDVDHVAERFDSVVIASGDGFFAGLARTLSERGLSVWNATSSCSGGAARLQQACQHHLRLRVGPQCHHSTAA